VIAQQAASTHTDVWRWTAVQVLLTKNYMDFLGKAFRAWCNVLRLRKINTIIVRQQVRARWVTMLSGCWVTLRDCWVTL
jgi:hypothetical protein